MRIIDQKIWSSETLEGTNFSRVFDVSRCYAGSIQIAWGASNTGGETKLQASLDQTTWSDIPNTLCPVDTTSDSVLWNLSEIHYPYLRVKLEAYSPITITCNIFIKGG